MGPGRPAACQHPRARGSWGAAGTAGPRQDSGKKGKAGELCGSSPGTRREMGGRGGAAVRAGAQAARPPFPSEERRALGRARNLQLQPQAWGTCWQQKSFLPQAVSPHLLRRRMQERSAREAELKEITVQMDRLMSTLFMHSTVCGLYQAACSLLSPPNKVGCFCCFVGVFGLFAF